MLQTSTQGQINCKTHTMNFFEPTEHGTRCFEGTEIRRPNAAAPGRDSPLDIRVSSCIYTVKGMLLKRK